MRGVAKAAPLIERIQREGGVFVRMQPGSIFSDSFAMVMFVVLGLVVTGGGLWEITSGNLQHLDYDTGRVWRAWLYVIIGPIMLLGSLWMLVSHWVRKSRIRGVEFVRDGFRIVGRGKWAEAWPPIPWGFVYSATTRGRTLSTLKWAEVQLTPEGWEHRKRWQGEPHLDQLEGLLEKDSNTWRNANVPALTSSRMMLPRGLRISPDTQVAIIQAFSTPGGRKGHE